MFLELLARRNPDLIRAAVALHQSGALPPNSYVLDLDAVRQNARIIKHAADQVGLRVYPMTKQVGRNPLFVRALARAGMCMFVCVDWREAQLLAQQNARLGHVGHLVQIPRSAAGAVAALTPEVWTVFNLEKAREASAAAVAAGRTQDLLLRVVAPGDTFYPTHDGGIRFDDLLTVARQVVILPEVRIVGVTSFPTLLFDPASRTPVLTPNLQTIVRAAEVLRRELGLDITQLNAPGTTSAETMAMLAAAGATHVEPGHGYTGTTPWHAYRDLPERPAMCYLTEITDVNAETAYVLGGGFFVDPVVPPYPVQACVGGTGEQALGRRAEATLGPPGGIDYYARLNPRSARMAIGDSVVFGFRAQVFATRASVAVVRGIAKGDPKVAGIYDACGRRVPQPRS